VGQSGQLISILGRGTSYTLYQWHAFEGGTCTVRY
jgi:hypothetical protein